MKLIDFLKGLSLVAVMSTFISPVYASDIEDEVDAIEVEVQGPLQNADHSVGYFEIIQKANGGQKMTLTTNITFEKDVVEGPGKAFSYTKIVEGDEVTYGSSNGLFNLGAIQLDLGRVMNGEITLETFCEGLLQDQWELILASRDAAEEKAVAFLAKSEVAATAVADDGGEDLVDDGDDFEVGDDTGVVEDAVVDTTGGEDLVDDGDDFEVGDDAGVVEDDVVDATGDDV